MTIEPNITMRELLEQMPGAQRALFRKYHIGGCASCGFRPEETLSGVCERNESLPVNEVIDYLLASHEEDRKMLLEPVALAELRSTRTPAKLLDIRTREEFEAAKIDGSILFTQDLMQEILGTWDRNEVLVMIDHQGKRSLDAATFFAGHGFTAVKALRGGIDAWSAEADASVPRYALE